MVALLADLFERAAAADEPEEMNYVRKHALAMAADGLEAPAARLFRRAAAAPTWPAHVGPHSPLLILKGLGRL